MMSHEVSCPGLTGDDAIHRYVAGTLPAEEVPAFEVHLLGCPRCQAAVREGAAVSVALRRFRERRRWSLAFWALPLAAALIGVLLLRPRDRLRELGGMSAAPGFTGAAVRAAPDRGDAVADSGMTAYAAGDYKKAARLLTSLGTGGAGAAFYLGAARLMVDQPTSALAALARAAAPHSPYAADAHYLRAKAWLRLGRADSALAELETSARDPAAAERARALADSVRRARQ